MQGGWILLCRLGSFAPQLVPQSVLTCPCTLALPRPAPRRRTSLRILGTVGEPINPEAWRWYHQACIVS